MMFKPGDKLLLDSKVLPQRLREKEDWTPVTFFMYPYEDNVWVLVKIKEGEGHNGEPDAPVGYDKRDLYYVPIDYLKPVKSGPFTDDEYKEFFV